MRAILTDKEKKINLSFLVLESIQIWNRFWNIAFAICIFILFSAVNLCLNLPIFRFIAGLAPLLLPLHISPAYLMSSIPSTMKLRWWLLGDPWYSGDQGLEGFAPSFFPCPLSNKLLYSLSTPCTTVTVTHMQWFRCRAGDQGWDAGEIWGHGARDWEEAAECGKRPNERRNIMGIGVCDTVHGWKVWRHVGQLGCQAARRCCIRRHTIKNSTICYWQAPD